MLLIAYGTRPEYIKIKPILDQLTIPYKTLFTGQHMDIAPKDAEHILTIPEGPNRLDSIITACMNIPNSVFEGITHVMVQGDTTSAFGVALAAFHRQVTVMHLE